ncbi:MAG: tetratricopeptide repeat protein [Hamadaea sp.]|nr:tetratricopeptide repeat protein [Hamadaea sp.]
MTDNRAGQVVTFYSYKGGTGRTMALANVAWILAANGKRVLVADWDLESPGLYRFFKPFIAPQAFTDSGGVIDLIREYEWATTRNVPREEGWYRQYAKVGQHAFTLEWSFPDGGRVDFLPAGRQNNAYAASLSAMDWDIFHENLAGGQFLDALREDMKRNYDYALIDSRTGFGDVADICTIHLPDILVDCFTYSEQGIEGAAWAAAAVHEEYGARNIRILPVPMRVDLSEKVKADLGRAAAMQRFAGFPTGMSDDDRAAYWAAVAVPYQSFYAYEEILATFGDQPGSPRSLLYAYETLTRHITNGVVTHLPPMEETVRNRISARFQRQATAPEEEITLRYSPADRVWAEWVEYVLREGDIRVNDPQRGDGLAHEPGPAARDLVIVSRSGAPVEEATGRRQPLLVYVADLLPLGGHALTDSAFLANQSPQTAADRLLRLVGRADAEVDAEPRGRGARFPGAEPSIFKVLARNMRFTGRESDLQELRNQLRAVGKAAVLQGTEPPIALHGMGGIGKTQIALEYAHRYRSAYDVVWWVRSDPSTFVDTEIADLGARLGVSQQPTVRETANATLQALERGEPYARWLLIFDNAEDIARIESFVPRGGHVLITSRKSEWGEQATTITVDVFERAESIAHLRQRASHITEEEADKIADALGDLPIFVAAAGAWLADTGLTASVYLQELERVGPEAEAAEKTWSLSLHRLHDRSPAAYRLLQLCSVLASEVSLELINSDEMAAKLVEYDPSVSERLVRGAMVQQINLLALLKLDPQGGQIQVHRLLQHVIRSQMTPEELDKARADVHAVLAASRPRGDVDDPQTWRRFRMLWPHLEVSDAIRSTDELVRQLLIDRVRYLWLRGDLQEGGRVSEFIDSAWTALLAATPEPQRAVLRRQLLHMRFNHANILRDEARFEESRALDMEVLREQTELLGAEHPHTLMTAGGLAADLRALGRYAEALDRDEQTYAIWSLRYGDDNPRTLAALNNLASSYRHMGNFRAARERDEKVYSRRSVVLGEDHPSTLASASNLARDLREGGDYEQSIDLLQQITARYLESRGPDFRWTLNTQANLAVSLRSAGRYEQAGVLLDNAYTRLLETLGSGGPDTIACRHSRAANFLALGDNQLALAELEAVHRTYQESLGPRHPHTLLCVNNLAVAARAAGDRLLARERAQVAADAFDAVLGGDHPYTVAAKINLAVCAAEVGDLEVALAPLQEAAGLLATVLGPEHPDTVRCEANLAIVRGDLGQPGAEAQRTRVLARLVQRLGTAHPAVRALRDGRLLHRIVEPHPF